MLSSKLQIAPDLITPSSPAHSEDLMVVGNRVMYGDVQVYIPEGISIYGGLERPYYKINLSNIKA